MDATVEVGGLANKRGHVFRGSEIEERPSIDVRRLDPVVRRYLVVGDAVVVQLVDVRHIVVVLLVVGASAMVYCVLVLGNLYRSTG